MEGEEGVEIVLLVVVGVPFLEQCAEAMPLGYLTQHGTHQHIVGTCSVCVCVCGGRGGGARACECEGLGAEGGVEERKGNVIMLVMC